MIDSVDVRKGRSAYMVMITKDWRQTSNQSSGGGSNQQLYSAKLIRKISCLIVSN